MNDASKPVWFILFVVVGLATIVVIARSRSGGGGGDGAGVIAWQTDVTDAREQSAKDGKPVLLYFTADWCPPCQQMKKSTWLDSQVADVIKAGYIPVMVDIDQQPNVGNEYRVSSIPRVEVVAANGDRRLITEGYMSPQEMAAALK